MKPTQTPRITTKITQRALRLLRMIAAQTGERQYQALERIIRDEWSRLKSRNDQESQESDA